MWKGGVEDCQRLLYWGDVGQRIRALGESGGERRWAPL